MIHEIVNGVYISDFDSAFNNDALNKLQITHILNVASEINVYERVGYAYCKYGVPDDDPNYDISKSLLFWANHIKTVKAQGGRILVHCWEGLSRSVCAILAYMTTTEDWSMERAVDHISKKKQIDVFPKYMDSCESLR